MKTLLINPPWFILLETELGQNSTPSGLCYLAAALEQHNYQVKILNAERTDEKYYYDWAKESDVFESFRSRDIRQHPVWEKISDKIRSFGPGIVGITVRTPAVKSSLYLSELIKKIDRRILVAVGGPHPTVLPEEILSYSYVDFVVRGEGEGTIVELVDSLSRGKALSSVAGLSYKLNGKIMHNPDRPLLDIDNIPHPAKYLMLDLDTHDQDDFNPVMTSRGCPYSCIFCGSSNV